MKTLNIQVTLDDNGVIQKVVCNGKEIKSDMGVQPREPYWFTHEHTYTYRSQEQTFSDIDYVVEIRNPNLQD